MCMRAGCAWGLDVRGGWMCMGAGCAWGLDVCGCQDRFFANLIFQGVRGSGHSLAVRPKGYVAQSHFPKGRKADRGFRQGV